MMNRKTGTKERAPIIIGILLMTSMLMISLAPPLMAADWGPWEAPAPPSPTHSQAFAPLDLAVGIFQKYISPIDGARCPMYPTCSAYARQALRKHGPLLGSFMTADRLIHEGDPREHQKPIIKWGHKRFYDPLNFNDFWWERK